MNKKALLLGLIIPFSISVSLAVGGNASVEMGEKLFNDPTLGGSKNQQSCATCHPGGEGLQASADRGDLTEMVNRCIVGALAGKKIDGRSAEMLSLKMYIISLKNKK